MINKFGVDALNQRGKVNRKHNAHSLMKVHVEEEYIRFTISGSNNIVSDFIAIQLNLSLYKG